LRTTVPIDRFHARLPAAGDRRTGHQAIDVDPRGARSTHERKGDAMQYILLIYDPEKTWAQMPKEESQKLFTEYMHFTQDIKQTGKWLAGDALQPPSTATTVRVRGGKVQTTDGPFAETKEQLGGYYLIEAKDLDEATKIAARVPSAHTGTIEVRPLM